MAKEEIAHFEQLLLWSECFQKSSAAEESESIYMRERETHMVKNTAYLELSFYWTLYFDVDFVTLITSAQYSIFKSHLNNEKQH